MAIQTVLGHVILWCDKDDPIDTARISNIKNKDLSYWTEVKEIAPPAQKFSNGNPTDECKWYEAKVVTDVSENQLSPPHVFGARLALTRALDSTPESVSFRWKK